MSCGTFKMRRVLERLLHSLQSKDGPGTVESGIYTKRLVAVELKIKKIVSDCAILFKVKSMYSKNFDTKCC